MKAPLWNRTQFSRSSLFGNNDDGLAFYDADTYPNLEHVVKMSTPAYN
jgi:hypothetical protein